MPPSSGYMPYVAAKKVNDTPGIDFWRCCAAARSTHTRHAARSFKLFARRRQPLGNCVHSRTQTAAQLSWSSVTDLRNVARDRLIFLDQSAFIARYNINLDTKNLRPIIVFFTILALYYIKIIILKLIINNSKRKLKKIHFNF